MLMSTKRRYSGGRVHREDAPAGHQACSLTRKPLAYKSVPETPAPSTARSPFYEAAKDKGPGVSSRCTPNRSPLDFGPRETWTFGNNPVLVEMLPRCGGSGAQVPSSSSAPAGPQKSAPLLELRGRRSRPQAAVAGRRQCSSAEDPLLRAGVFVQLTGPLHHSRRRESRRPVPASSRLRSHAQISMTLSKWGNGRKGAGAGTQRDVFSAPTPPAKLTSAHNATGSRTRSKSPHEPPRPAGHGGLSPKVARREAGRKEGSDLQSHTSCPHASLPAAGEGCALAPPPPVTTARAARPKPPREPRFECPDRRMQ